MIKLFHLSWECSIQNRSTCAAYAVTALRDEQITVLRLCCADTLISNGQRSIKRNILAQCKATRRERWTRQIWLTLWSWPLWRHCERSAQLQMAKIFENGVVASRCYNFLRRISPIIPASNGIVFGSQGVIIIFLSWEVRRF